MQGFNMGRYVPPDAEGLVSANALHKKHALGSRASKLASHGTLTVRFEMPFAVWCAHCPQPTVIGQGVRFNAAKKRAGNYHSTPIWSFTMRHNVCGGEIEIRTDPQHTDYIVVSGGRRRDLGVDEDSLVPAGELAVLTERERAEQRESAFGKLEKTIADRERLFDAGVRIDELQDASERQWEDPYAQNQRLRRAFRVGRKEREVEAGRTGELKDRMSLGIEILPETREDAVRAGLVDFGGVDVETDRSAEKALARPLFESVQGKEARKPRGKLKSEIAADKTRESLVSEIVGNTRAARDPFLVFGYKETPAPKAPARLPGLKRKRDREETSDLPEPVISRDAGKPALVNDGLASKTLVSYDSDSD